LFLHCFASHLHLLLLGALICGPRSSRCYLVLAARAICTEVPAQLPQPARCPALDRVHAHTLCSPRYDHNLCLASSSTIMLSSSTGNQVLFKPLCCCRYDG
jgi:hypothetical protein